MLWWEEPNSKSVRESPTGRKERCSRLEQLKDTGGEGFSVGDLAGICIESLLLTRTVPSASNSRLQLYRQKPEDNKFKACL